MKKCAPTGSLLPLLTESLWRLKAGEPIKDIARTGPRQQDPNHSPAAQRGKDRQ